MGYAGTRRALWFTAWFWLIAAISCRAPAIPKDTSLRIEIDVYSGRPNPSFTLNGAACEQLAGKLRDLPKAGRETPEPGLGYRGFLVTGSNKSYGLPPVLRVVEGLVVAEADSQTIVCRDVHGAEAWLKEQAKQAGYGALVP